MRPNAQDTAERRGGGKRQYPPFGLVDTGQSSRLAAGQARPGDQSLGGTRLGEGADVGSARAAGYSSASEYVRVTVIMPSASN
jgi:hypothetical protein